MMSWITRRRPRLTVHLVGALQIVGYSIVHFWVFIWFCILSWYVCVQ